MRIHFRYAALAAAVLLALGGLGCDDSPVGPDGNGSGSSDTSPAPSACFTTTPDPARIDSGQTIVLDAGCSENVDDDEGAYFWDLGDGRTETGRVVEVRYTRTGTFEVELTVRMNDRFETATKRVDVRPLPEACFTFEQVRGDTSMLCTVAFDASCSTGDVAEYAWFFEGGRLPPESIPDANITTDKPRIVYSWGEDFECRNFRTFRRKVRLTVIDDRGVTDEKEDEVVFFRPFLRP